MLLPLLPRIPKRLNFVFVFNPVRVFWGGGRGAGSRYDKASFSLVRTQGQIGKDDMAPSLTPLLPSY